VGGWIGRRSRDEVIAAFDLAQAAIAPIYDASDIMDDPQFRSLGTIHTIVDEDLGEMRMQGPLFRLSVDEPVIAFTGRSPGADTDALLTEVGYTQDEIDALRADGSVA
jgi:crotonobetainyl-CoA:carnitine CoA-transferase CaiB-like acyl-CoA transferase